MIEFLEDQIEEDPQQEFPQDVQESGRYVKRTGDALFDKWQEKAVVGEVIDFDEGLDAESIKVMDAIKERSRRKYAEKTGVVVPEVEMPEDIHEKYGDDKEGG